MNSNLRLLSHQASTICTRRHLTYSPSSKHQMHYMVHLLFPAASTVYTLLGLFNYTHQHMHIYIYIYIYKIIIIIQSIVPSRNIRLSMSPFHFCLSAAKNLSSFQLLPASLIINLLQLFFGLPLFLFPWGFQSRAACGISSSSFS